MDKEKDVIEYFENLIAFEVPLPKILRSMCLQCIIDKGVNKKVYARICDDIAITYGAEHIVSMSNLARTGLFFDQGNREANFSFNDIKKELKLINDDSINHENPSDPSFAYGGYCPILYFLPDLAPNLWKELSKMDGKPVLKP